MGWVQEDARRLARTIARDQERYILGTRQLLLAIAETPMVRDPNRQRCDEYLGQLQAKNPLYTIISVADRKGDPTCSSLDSRTNLSDRGYFKQAMSTGEFAMGQFQIGRTTGRATISFAQPLKGRDGTPDGIVLASHDLARWVTQRAAGLSLQMLAYSGRSYVVARRVQLSEVVLETTTAAQATLPPTITLDVRVNRTLPDIDGDPAQITQLLTNLVTNAVEAMGEARGTVIVSTGLAMQPARGEGAAAEGEHVYLKVTDTGPGIPDDVKPRIFEPFFSTKFTGRGLGLAVVSGIVRAHGGFVLVESVPGHGSTFTVMFPKLPVAKADSRPRSSVSAA